MGKSNIKIPANSVSGEDSSWLADRHFLTVFSRGTVHRVRVLEGWGKRDRERERERETVSGASSYKDTNPIGSGLHTYNFI